MPTYKVNEDVLIAAVDGLELQKARIDGQIAELRAMLDGGPASPAATPEAAPQKRKISAAARRRMALGQKKRWAAIKGTAESTPAMPEPPKAKRKLSAAGKAAIVAALKKRWAAKKAAAKKAKPTKKAAKKSTTKKAAKTSGQAAPAAQ